MSLSVRNGEFAGTTIASYSPVRRAIGVTSRSVTGERCMTTPPSMMRPDTRIASSRPCSEPTNRASPIVPAAPGMFSTGALRTRPVRCSTCCITRAV